MLLIYLFNFSQLRYFKNFLHLLTFINQTFKINLLTMNVNFWHLYQGFLILKFKTYYFKPFKMKYENLSLNLHIL